MGTLTRASDGAKPFKERWSTTRLLVISHLAMFMLSLSACDTAGRKRSIGYVRLGPAAEIAQRPETFFSEARVLLRYDDEGFSAMSTACTYDLSALTRLGEGSSQRWVSSYSSSAYDDQGRVLVGPTKSNLPFYKLRIAAGTYGGVPDTLFVEIGTEVEAAWRLPFKLSQ